MKPNDFFNTGGYIEKKKHLTKNPLLKNIIKIN